MRQVESIIAQQTTMYNPNETSRTVALALLLSPLLVAPIGAGEVPFSLSLGVEGVEYSDSVPKPDEVVGHQIGTRHTTPAQIVRYFETVARSSPRVRVEQHGTTYEGRPLVHAVVTSVENQDRLEEIRSRNLELSQQPGLLSDSTLSEMPAVVLMGYSVHGNEASGSEASVLLLYHLAAGSGPDIDKLLTNCVIIIDPMLNPDGRSRFVDWVNFNRGRIAVADPNHREHNEPWPGGRTNHYWFDLNRDWLPAQLKETRARLELFHNWRPQLMTDFHEMGSEATFFFQPGVPSRNNPNIPRETVELTRRIAAFHAKYLDRIGSLYYSEENYDDFYFGKGSTYPDINGAIGILFEQASSRALRREVSWGVLRYDFTIRNQFMASLSSLEAAAAIRPDLLAHQQRFYQESLRESGNNGIRAYLIDTASDGQRGRLLIEVLQRHRVEVHELNTDVVLEGRTFRADSTVIVPTRQVQSRLLKVLMEKVTDFSDSVFYDVSTWTLPLAFAVRVGEMRDEPGKLLGPEMREIPAPTAGITGSPTPYAYLLPWESYRSPQALYALQDRGIQARVVFQPLQVDLGGTRVRLERGTVVIPAEQPELKREQLVDLIEAVAEDHRVRVLAVGSGITYEGPDLGGPSSRTLQKPRLAVLCGPGVSSSQAGETWYMLDEITGVPVTLLETERFDRTDLSRYNTLVVPGGSYSSLNEASAKRLADWVRAGGLLLSYGGGIGWLVRNEIVKESPREWTLAKKNLPYDEVDEARRSQTIPGSIFEARLDVTHPLAFGLEDRLPFFRDHDLLYEPSEAGGANVAVYTEEPLLSGYVSAEKLPQMAGSSAVLARRVGSGHVVLFVDNPNFRGFWYGTSAMFLNALFFGHTF